MAKKLVEAITSMEDDFAQWYTCLLYTSVTWEPNRNTVQTTGSLPWHDIRFRENHGKRPRPVFLSKDLCSLRYLCRNLRCV